MEVTRYLNWLVKLLLLLSQIRYYLAIIASAEVILRQISAEQVPALHRIAPSYLKLVRRGRRTSKIS